MSKTPSFKIVKLKKRIIIIRICYRKFHRIKPKLRYIMQRDIPCFLANVNDKKIKLLERYAKISLRRKDETHTTFIPIIFPKRFSLFGQNLASWDKL